MNLKIEQLKKELEETIHNPNSSIEEITKISCNIDEEIEKEYLKRPNKLNTKEQLKEYLEREDRQEVMKQIKADLLKTNKVVSLVGLDIISNNIYCYCCLKIHQVPEEKITDFIIYKNNNYCDIISDDKKKKATKELQLENLTEITDKYVKILGNKNL